MSTHPTHIGAYEVVRLLGRGGMGAVYLARDPAIGRLVAIKLLREGVESDELRERFAREARAAGGLRHPNIVTIFQAGPHEVEPYLVMEYIPGDTLAQVVERRLPLSVPRKLRIIEEVCHGLAYAHRAGIVHRDVKPANILVDPDGIVKILDFGIARMGEAGLTRSGMVVGSLNYMAPEQIDPGTADHRSDVFAVGLVLYELLTYQKAFPGQDFSVFHRILHTEPAPIDTLCADIPPDLVDIVGLALRKNPDERYQDLAGMRVALSRVRMRLRVRHDDVSDEGPLVVSAASAVSADDDTAAQPAPAPSIEAPLAAARKALDEQRFADALEASDKVLALAPEHPAAIEIRDAARRATALAKAHTLLGVAQQEWARGDESRVRELLGEADVLAAEAPVPTDLQRAFTRLKDEVEALEAARERARQCVARGQEALAAGRLGDAQEALDESQRLAPADAAVVQLGLEIAAESARRQAEAEAAERARREAEAEAKRLAEEAAAEEAERRRLAEEQARREAEQAAERARRKAEAKAEAEAKRLAAAKAAEEQARLEAEAQARLEAEAEARRLAEEQAAAEEAERRRLAEEQARLEAEARARREAEEAAERARREAEAEAKRLAEEQARREAEAEAKRLAEEQAAAEEAERRRLAEEQARREAEEAAERARRKAEAKAEAEAKRLAAAKAAEEQARLEAEARARREAEEAAERARRKAEAKAEAEAKRLAAAKAAEEQARRDTEDRARADAHLSAVRTAVPVVSPPVAVPAQAAKPTTTTPGTSIRPAHWMAAAALLLTLGLGAAWLGMSSPTDGSPANGDEAADTATSDEAASSAEPAPGDPPPIDAPAADPSAGETDNEAEATTPPAVRALHDRLVPVMRRADVAAALTLIERADPAVVQDPLVQADLDRLLTTARRATDAALAGAQQADAPTLAATEHQTGLTRRAASVTAARQGNKPRALRALLDATTAFTEATQAARAATTARQQTPPDVAPQPQRPAEPPVTTADNTSATQPTESPRPDPVVREAAKSPPPVVTPAQPVDETPAIRAVLDQFVRGYETLDVGLVRRVWPSAPAGLTFDNVRSQTVTLTNVRISQKGDAATVTCTRQVTTQLAAGRPQSASQSITFSMTRRAGAWIILSVTAGR